MKIYVFLRTVGDFEAGPRDAAMSKTQAAMGHVMELRGVDLQYDRTLPGPLRAMEFDDVDTEGLTGLWRGGSLGAAMIRANCEQLLGDILNSGLVTAAEFEEDLARLADPTFVMRSSTLWAAWGRRG